MASEAAQDKDEFIWTQREVNKNPVPKLDEHKNLALEEVLALPGFKRMEEGNVKPVMSTTSTNAYAILALDAMHSPDEPETKQDRIADRVKQVFDVAVVALDDLDKKERSVQKLDYLTNTYMIAIHTRLVKADPAHWRVLHWRVNNVRYILQSYGRCLDLEAENEVSSSHSLYQSWIAVRDWHKEISRDVPAPVEVEPRGDKLEDHDDGRDDMASLLEKRNNEKYLGVGKECFTYLPLRYDLPQEDKPDASHEQNGSVEQKGKNDRK